jgi:hypothetical protein
VGQDLIARMTAAATEYGAAWSAGWSAIGDGQGTEVAAMHLRRASEHLVTLVEGLKELHEQLDRPPVLPGIGAYGPDDVLRIVRAAVAFRNAAPEHTWPHQPWSEMAELCAAVDRKPGPARDPGPPPIEAAPRVSGGAWHALVLRGAHYRPACNLSGPPTSQPIDVALKSHARRVPADRRCHHQECTKRYAIADRADS